MPTPEDFLTYTQWSGLSVLVFAGLAALAFWQGWGIRFRLVGVTGFMGVLTVGLFALSLVPLTRTVVPGAQRYTLVYDVGANQVVIAVAPTLSRSGLEATMLQAAGDLFSPGRMGGATNQLTIRARTILHPEPGMSEPLYLGTVQRSLRVREDPNLQLTLDEASLAQLPNVAG
ncbi:hypothetical protein GS597_18425 [Synechococcales cyanobacterium C]|uniref:Uncharacterized protein n=1 Tax=Petrachloros mirabilis ULC683 TaxID=2781853 RepID=A0A8K2A000_9CYAN|nr:Ycf51 family protein [Petrachloros mirabilis]NCJ08445.1 hypothetical protein [Petrachloros mirabilis ULC683]